MGEINTTTAAINIGLNQRFVEMVARMNEERLAYYLTRVLPDWKLNVQTNTDLGLPLDKWPSQHRNPPVPPRILKAGPTQPDNAGAIAGLITSIIETADFAVPPEVPPRGPAAPAPITPGGEPQFGGAGYNGTYGASKFDRTPDWTEVTAPNGSRVYKHPYFMGFIWMPIAAKLSDAPRPDPSKITTVT